MKNRYNYFYLLLCLPFAYGIAAAEQQKQTLTDEWDAMVVDAEDVVRSGCKTFERVCVKNLLSARKLRVCDVNVLGTLTVNGQTVTGGNSGSQREDIGELFFEAESGPEYLPPLLPSVPFELQPATSLTNSIPAEFDMPAAGRLRYVGAGTKTFHVSCSISCHNTNIACLAYFQCYKNGIPVVGSGVQYYTLFNAPITFAFNKVITLSTNDFISVYATDLQSSNSTPLSIYNLNIVAVG